MWVSLWTMWIILSKNEKCNDAGLYFSIKFNKEKGYYEAPHWLVDISFKFDIDLVFGYDFDTFIISIAQKARNTCRLC